MGKGAMTINEMEFQQEYGQTLSAAHHLLLRYRVSNVAADILQVPVPVRACHSAMS